MHICMGKVLLWGIEFRVQGAGGVHGDLVMLKVCVELLGSMTAPSLHSTPNIGTWWGSY